MRDKRIVEVFRGGVWVKAEMSSVVAGERFRMFESDGQAVVGEDKYAGQTEFTAGCDAYNVGNGRWAVNGE